MSLKDRQPMSSKEPALSKAVDRGKPFKYGHRTTLSYQVSRPKFLHSAAVMFAQLIVALVIATLAVASLSHPEPKISKSDSSSWAGSNLYFLHGLDAETQSAYIEALAGWGVKVLRLWGELFIPTSYRVPTSLTTRPVRSLRITPL